MTTQNVDAGDDAAAAADSPAGLWVTEDGGLSAGPESAPQESAPQESAPQESTPQESTLHSKVSRRTLIRVGAVGAAGVALTAGRAVAEPYLAQQGELSADGVFAAAETALTDLVYIEAFPVSPLILTPFVDVLPVPKALKPIAAGEYTNWQYPPGPGNGEQNGSYDPKYPLRNQNHQIWPTQDGKYGDPVPIVYKIDHLVNTHAFTTSQVRPITKKGKPAVSFDASGKTYPAGTVRTLPKSTIYGFNGVFPGPMINAEYGRPVIVRFENRLDENP